MPGHKAVRVVGSELIDRIRELRNSGHSLQETADALGLSKSAVFKYAPRSEKHEGRDGGKSNDDREPGPESTLPLTRQPDELFLGSADPIRRLLVFASEVIHKHNPGAPTGIEVSNRFAQIVRQTLETCDPRTRESLNQLELFSSMAKMVVSACVKESWPRVSFWNLNLQVDQSKFIEIIAAQLILESNLRITVRYGWDEPQAAPQSAES